MKRILILILILNIICISCSNRRNSNKYSTDFQDIKLVDTEATFETKALYYNLKKISSKNILFGQEDATAYGIGWNNEDLRSDINDICGTFPSIYGWDLGRIGSAPYNIDSVNFDRIKFWIKSAYERGGINTISWHMFNPKTGNRPNDTIHAVKDILPGGKLQQIYLKQLNCIADFILDLKSKKGTLIPIIFRPFHEMNGNWFWWGASHCSPDQYKELWKFTVNYLKEKRNIHNIIYAYSPGNFYSESKYLERYPGNKYVDILGFDCYSDFGKNETISQAISQIRILVTLAKKVNKIAALTETGLDCLPVENWFTMCLLYPVKNDSIARGISYIMVWRNFNKTHFFVPYSGHPAVKDFIKFENDPYTLFEYDMPKMYEVEKQFN